MAREEIKAGLFTIAALGVLSLFVVLISGFNPWRQEVDFLARFRSASGVDVGTPVRMQGLLVGKVSRVALTKDYDAVELTLGLRPDFQLRDGVTAEISRTGLIGDTFILLTQAKPAGSALKPGSLVPTVDRPGMDQALEAVSRLAGSAENAVDRVSKRLETLLGDVQGLVNADNLAQVRQSFGKWEATISVTLKDLAQLSDQAGGAIRELSDLARELTTMVRDDNGHLRTALSSISRITHEVEKAVAADQAQLAVILEQVREASTRVNRLAGKSDQAADLALEDLVRVTSNMAEASRNLISLTERLRANPSLIVRPGPGAP